MLVSVEMTKILNSKMNNCIRNVQITWFELLKEKKKLRLYKDDETKTSVAPVGNKVRVNLIPDGWLCSWRMWEWRWFYLLKQKKQKSCSSVPGLYNIRLWLCSDISEKNKKQNTYGAWKRQIKRGCEILPGFR